MNASNELQTLRRGLEALAFLNANNGTNLSTLARHLDVPRANAYRILQTLIADGYCHRIPNSRLYMVGPEVRRLSSGLHDGEILTSIAMPIVEELGRTVKWPVALATPDGSQMLVRLTTDRASPLALGRINPGYRTPMLMTTTGILYLAFARPEIRERTIAAMLEAGAINTFVHNQADLDDLIETSRRTGYMILDHRYPEGCIGVPILRQGEPIGGLVMRYIKSAMSRDRAVEIYLPQLRAAVDRLLAAMDGMAAPGSKVAA